MAPAPLFLLRLLLLLGGALALAAAVEGVGQAAEPPSHFLIQNIQECSFNGTGPEGEPPAGVHFINRYIYDRQEYVRFDSTRGEFEAVSPFGEPDARLWNSRKDLLEEERAKVEIFCRHNYGIFEPFALSRRVQPKVVIIPTDDPSSNKTVLTCFVDSFYPPEIEIKWFRNGKEEGGLEEYSTSYGDWTYYTYKKLETMPLKGDVYTCQVEHASFPSPVTVQWEPQSDSARSKMWTGVAGIILGLAFLAPGLILYLKNKKGDVLPQPPVPLMS